MRAAILLIVLLLGVYTLWQLAQPAERRHATRLLGRHGPRVAGVVLMVLALLALATVFPSINLL